MAKARTASHILTHEVETAFHPYKYRRLARSDKSAGSGLAFACGCATMYAMIKRRDGPTEKTSGDGVQDRHPAENQSTLRKIALMTAGVIAIILGTVGIFVPLLPTTPFLLLAAACFVRSSDRLYDWLIHHRWFGTYIRNYREHRAIPLSTKILAITLLWSTITYTGLVVIDAWIIRGLLLAIAVGVTLHLLKLKTMKPSPDPEQTQPSAKGQVSLKAACEEPD